MSKTWGLTFTGYARHIRDPADPGMSICRRGLCDDVSESDDYPSHPDCRRCAKRWTRLQAARDVEDPYSDTFGSGTC